MASSDGWELACLLTRVACKCYRGRARFTILLHTLIGWANAQATLSNGVLSLVDTVAGTQKSWKIAPADSYKKLEVQHDFDAGVDANTMYPQFRIVGQTTAVAADQIGGAIYSKTVSPLISPPVQSSLLGSASLTVSK